jgi:hypothetical protein
MQRFPDPESHAIGAIVVYFQSTPNFPSWTSQDSRQTNPIEDHRRHNRWCRRVSEMPVSNGRVGISDGSFRRLYALGGFLAANSPRLGYDEFS